VTAREGRVIGGRYRLERPLAKGGMGEVWTARHTTLEAPVAVKFMEPALVADAEARRRFEREAKAAAALRSPHVVQILDFGLDDESPYLVMELLRGETLQERLRQGPLDRVAASKVLAHACKALELAAEAGIVHRDLKPANLFLARSGGEETVKILDFGVAKSERTEAGESTAGGRMIGSPHYMSPEQARGGMPVDHRSDLWSLGVIAFHMLTGRRPFDGPDLGDVILKICTEPIPKPSDHGQPAAVDRFFATALARDPAARFPSASAMSAAFRALCVELGDAEIDLHAPLAAPVGAPPLSEPSDDPAALETLRGTITQATAPRRGRLGLWALAAVGVTLAGFVMYRAFQGENEARPPVAAAPVAEPVPSATAAPTATAAATTTATVAATASSARPPSRPAAPSDRHRILGY
jgi:serine/threonine-protein kinase